MRQEITGGVHQMNTDLGIFNPNMHVHSEYQVRSSDYLKILDNSLVALARGDLLAAPVRKRVGSRGSHAKSVLFRQGYNMAPDFLDIFFSFFDVAANSRTNFYNGLMHLRLDTFP